MMTTKKRKIAELEIGNSTLATFEYELELRADKNSATSFAVDFVKNMLKIGETAGLLTIVAQKLSPWISTDVIFKLASEFMDKQSFFALLKTSRRSRYNSSRSWKLNMVFTTLPYAVLVDKFLDSFRVRSLSFVNNDSPLESTRAKPRVEVGKFLEELTMMPVGACAGYIMNRSFPMVTKLTLSNHGDFSATLMAPNVKHLTIVCSGKQKIVCDFMMIETIIIVLPQEESDSSLLFNSAKKYEITKSVTVRINETKSWTTVDSHRVAVSRQVKRGTDILEWIKLYAVCAKLNLVIPCGCEHFTLCMSPNINIVAGRKSLCGDFETNHCVLPNV